MKNKCKITEELMVIKTSQSQIWALMHSFWTLKQTILPIQSISDVLSMRKFLFVYNDGYSFSPNSIKTAERQHTDIWRPRSDRMMPINTTLQSHWAEPDLKIDRGRKEKSMTSLCNFTYLSLTYYLPLFTWKTLSHYCQKDSGIPSL